ncbi:3-phosphoserine/phosphohydroxythreonine transaminase [Testudinibacter sp. TR-2022]|uniref:3-phosphoserine/phosphohydroxythreonine transaminase n=1 Tax=Testudinibacter sp. TR-2022 TaxID=2585029 RepID=UPI0011183179|nr:3-phosphoserine/phosphohydroxythreonine transaminase [Testudinibacter sp. TR-2022]TNH06087.1 3-phosphoserine/phosphohydroxythreonine transaminase [Pasteurellaceae bacterium Phil11]TNH23322.1 3-phosphoserine/phosphohydroxythreonine transaminase [Testudinibacter sp. TR-2022]TNH24490.1 3-phosphoserine/phosphohydroxythreonine transaminase [Testudinibacter sp. TR-2022]
MSKVFNFSAGPAMMPQAVLAQAQQELLNWEGLQTSVMEVSHRGKHFMALAERSIQQLRELLAIPDNYQVLFAQGGARGQFAAVPMNLLSENGKALYLNSGYWSAAAAKEARLFGEINEVTISAEQDGVVAVDQLDFSEVAAQYDYVHYCPNETISGIEIFDVPKVGDAVLVADMSSNILSRAIDVSKFGVIYAGAQKNMGPSGIVILIVRDDLIGKARANTPSIWNYQILRDNDSMFNTPPTFAWYLCSLVFQWLLDNGGLTAMESRNRAKAEKLYAYLDQSDFYRNTVAVANRSLMNVTFTCSDDELNAKFVAEATKCGLQALKGHRIVGGMRASIYNAMPLEGVEALIAFMQQFAQANQNS